MPYRPRKVHPHRRYAPTVEDVFYLCSGHDWFAVDMDTIEAKWHAVRAALVPFFQSYAPTYRLWGEWAYDAADPLPWAWGQWDAKATGTTRLDLCRQFLQERVS